MPEKPSSSTRALPSLHRRHVLAGHLVYPGTVTKPGEHTAEVLSDWGLDDDTVAELVGAGAVGYVTEIGYLISALRFLAPISNIRCSNASTG